KSYLQLDGTSSPNSRICSTPNGASSTSKCRKRSRPCSADLEFNSFPDRLLETLKPYYSPVQRRDAIDVELLFLPIPSKRQKLVVSGLLRVSARSSTVTRVTSSVRGAFGPRQEFRSLMRLASELGSLCDPAFPSLSNTR